MKFCTYNSYIACYFLYVQFRKSVIFVRTILHILVFCTYNFGVFRTLYVQFCPLFMKNIGLIWKFSKAKWPKNGKKPVLFGVLEIFLYVQKLRFLAILGYFCPFCGHFAHFYTPFLLYMNFTNIFVKSKYSAKPTKKPGKWAESKFYTNRGGIYEKQLS